MNANIILAAANTDTFWNSPIGGTIEALLVAIGILVVILALFKGVPKFIGGKIGEGLKIILGGLIVAALCFQPSLLTDLIAIVGNLLGQGSESFDDVTKNGGGGNGNSGR